MRTPTVVNRPSLAVGQHWKDARNPRRVLCIDSVNTSEGKILCTILWARQGGGLEKHRRRTSTYVKRERFNGLSGGYVFLDMHLNPWDRRHP